MLSKGRVSFYIIPLEGVGALRLTCA